MLKVRDILANPVFKYMSMHMEIKDAETVAPQGNCSGDILPMPITKWFFEQKMSKQEHYNQSVLCEVDSEISVEQLQEVMSEIVHFHDALRMNYDTEKECLYYNNKHLEQSVMVESFDMREVSEEQGMEEMEKVKAEIEGGFQIETDLLIKAALFQMSDTKQILFLCAHHLVIDGVSWRIIIEDINTLIRQQQKREPLNLGNKTYSYQDWAKQINEFSQKVFDEMDYWKEEVSSEFQFNGYKNPFDSRVDKNTVSICLDKKYSEMLQKEANRAYRTETNDLLITALARTMKAFGTSQDIIIEVEGHGRDESLQLDVSRTVGWFTKMYPMKFTLGQDDISWQIKQVKEKIRKVPNQGIGYGILRYLTNKMPYQEKYVRFNYLGDAADEKRGSVRMMDCITEMDQAPENKLSSILDINCIVVKKELYIFLTYDAVHLEKENMKAFLEQYKNSIQMIIEHCTKNEEEEFTPSDFETVELTDSDFDALFD